MNNTANYRQGIDFESPTVSNFPLHRTLRVTPQSSGPTTAGHQDILHVEANNRTEGLYQWRKSLDLIARYVPVTKCKVATNDQIYVCGQSFKTLHLINSGLFKILSLAPDGRERSADFFFEGDWLGFDGMATGQHSCSTIALDIGEIWAVQYDSLMQAAVKEPLLLRHVLGAVGGQLARNRDITLSIGTLSAEAKVADFLLMWANSLAKRGRRTDQINIRQSRADIGDFLGIRLESVSRSLSKLAQCGIIAFKDRGRRDISILDLNALSEFVQKDSETRQNELH
ncbi:MAG: Crp/Fnr family transcriptional regulator [Rhodoferax sp.]|nr:Crp/Fnr family transcriptional regulator [Rhodoferax sp.]